MTKPPKRPIEAQDMPWSYIGKDALDEAAERVWNMLADEHTQLAVSFDGHADPYHLALSTSQAVVQRAVLDVLGTTVPAMLRQRAKELKADGIDVDNLIDLADELEGDHG
jgi:hypothetical protein